MIENFLASLGARGTINAGQSLDVYTWAVLVFIFQCVVQTAFTTIAVFNNLLNVLVFIKQGLNSTINVSFLALSLSDLSMSLFLLAINLGIINLFTLFNLFPVSNLYYSFGAWPYACMHKVSLFITAYITIERYLSIAAPLGVKSMITSKRSIAIIIVLALINILALVPIYTSEYTEWKFYPQFNRTLLTMSYNSFRKENEDIAFALHASLLVVAIAMVILFTILLIVQIKRQSSWRQIALTDERNNENASKRDAKAIKMVITIASMTIACHLLAVILSVVVVASREFKVYGAYYNLFDFMFSLTYTLESFSCAINTLVYYKMSSKYRAIVNSYIILVTKFDIFQRFIQ